MNKKEAAQFIGISERTLIRHTSAGKITAGEVRGKTGMVTDYTQAEVERFKAWLNNEEPGGIIEGETTETSSVTSLARRGTSSTTLARTRQDKGETAAPKVGVPIEHKLVLTLAEAQAMTGFSRGVLRAAIEAGELEARRIGRAFRVKRRDLESYVDKL